MKTLVEMEVQVKMAFLRDAIATRLLALVMMIFPGVALASTIASWSPDGKLLALAVSHGGKKYPNGVEIWNVETRTRLASWDSEALIDTVSWGPTANTVAFVAQDSLYLLDLASGAASKKLSLGCGAYELACSRDGALLAQACTMSGYVRIWRLLDSQPVYGERASKGVVIHVHWSGITPNETLGWLSAFGELRFWNVSGPDSMKAVTRDGSNIRDFAWSPDGRLLALALAPSLSCSGAGCFNGIQVYDTSGKGVLSRFRPSEFEPLEAIAWSPNGASIAALNTGKTLFILNGQAQVVRRIQLPSPMTVGAVAWNPVKDSIVASNIGGEVYIVNSKTGSVARFK
jgi:WD40 repeat protein